MTRVKTVASRYWEIVELSRKLILSGLVGLVGRGSVAQSTACTFISFFFFAARYLAQVIKIVKSFKDSLVDLRCSDLKIGAPDVTASVTGVTVTSE